ncbi:hypothetical protein EKN06_03685 [Croceicoccus ponticola]|uniref:Uncharacterized protein n=1 Tax=Croceicoccus ponticola TaxID=2217664 RepID=A0A437H116_9SPHN|nr:hypothetical protein [Croceicoccus ponticola]RVQ69298.1 hypothetical protein EKN06_03685 [Croceicoccus ponticola]
MRIPKTLREAYEGREILHKTMEATDKRTAQIEADAWEVLLKAEWHVRLSGTQPPTSIRRLPHKPAQQEEWFGW